MSGHEFFGMLFLVVYFSIVFYVHGKQVGYREGVKRSKKVIQR